MKLLFALEFFILIFFQINSFVPSPVDLSLIGVAQYNTGLGSIGIGIIDTLKNDILINHFELGANHLTGISQDVAEIIQNPDKTVGNVGLVYWFLTGTDYDAANAVKSHIKIAYSMLESTRIPEKWVTNFNENFDAVIVPDEWLKDVYVTCGVTIPLFILPHGIFLEDFLKEPIKEAPSKLFRFGSCATFINRKNQHLLIDAFLAEFAGDSNVELIVHGPGDCQEYLKEAKKKVEAHPIPSIKFSINQELSHEEYIGLMSTIDCYVLLSKGEGFSMTPREALALGIPTIISNNTGHTTICNSGYVSSVPSDIRTKAVYLHPELTQCGDNFNCELEDVRKELRNVYSNYSEHRKLAKEGREWVKRYTWKSLKNKFLMLVKPTTVILGAENVIGENFLMTNNEKLYNKYCDIARIKA